MTLPPSLSELQADALDVDAGAERALTRVSVLVGRETVDVGLPPHSPVGDLVDDVIDLARAQSDAQLDGHAGSWTFAKLGGGSIDRGRSLAEAGVYDGDLLVIQRVGARTAPPLFDDVTGADQPSRRSWLAANTGSVAWYTLAVACAVAAALMLPRLGPWCAATTLAAGTLCTALACVLPHRRVDAPYGPLLTTVALPLLFGGALYVVPDGHGVKALPMAMGVTALAALLALLITRQARPWYTAVIAAAVLGVPPAVAALVWQLQPRALGAALAMVAVLVVYLAPRATIGLTKLPIPRVPTAGEPLDDIETQGGTAVEGVNAIGKQMIPTEEGLAERVRQANEYLTGILAAATVAAVVGCYLADDVSNGFFWQRSAFAIMVAAVLCLRGRSHHDLAQSAMLIGGGLLIALTLIVKSAAQLPAWRAEAGLLLVALTVLIVWCGLVAPRLEFSPVQRRRVELLEYIAVAALFPLCFWIVRIYAFFRELHL